ncbi:MAG: 50S ribosomal protein L18 [Ktedonobacterales bacterium]|jgi:large subunit ribosomal protein L18
MIKKQYANQSRLRRHLRVRKRLAGTTERPRLCVFRSGNQIYAQIVDDAQGRTLVSASSRDADLAKVKSSLKATAEGEESSPTAYRGIEANRRVQIAYQVGSLLAERAKAAGLTRVVFDRGGYIYHGRVAALADGARKGGLDF